MQISLQTALRGCKCRAHIPSSPWAVSSGSTHIFWRWPCSLGAAPFSSL